MGCDLKALRSLAQHLVARRMPKQIVDLLETVEVDAEHREAAAALAGTVERPRKLAIQRGAVRQIRQRVVTRQMQDALLGAFAVGHVERHRNGGIALVVAQRPCPLPSAVIWRRV